MYQNEFEIEFTSEEEVLEMLDSIVASIGESVMEEEEKPAVLDPLKIQMMQFSYGVLKYLTGGTTAKLSYMLHEPFQSMGSVSVEGNKLTFSNTEWFARACEFASNTEVYPLTNGNVRITLTFHGLVRPIE